MKFWESRVVDVEISSPTLSQLSCRGFSIDVASWFAFHAGKEGGHMGGGVCRTKAGGTMKTDDGRRDTEGTMTGARKKEDDAQRKKE